MSFYKYIIGLAVLITALLAVNTESANGVYASYAPANKSHSWSVGERVPGDKLIHVNRVFRPPRWMEIVTVNRNYQVWEPITMIEAWDRETNGNGGYASILDGGIGHKNVTIKFESQRGRGFEFAILLYAVY